MLAVSLPWVAEAVLGRRPPDRWPEVESAGSSSLAAAGAGLEDLV